MGTESLERPSIVVESAWNDAGAEARACLVELARRLGMNSSNSSLPPSSDGPADATGSTCSHNDDDHGNSATGEKKKKKSGGQPGHPK